MKRALVALRERLVAMYETGTPDVLSLILDSNGYDELATRTEYLERIHGMDEAVVGRVRDLRDQVKDTVARLRSAKNRIEAARDAIAAEERALASARRAVQERQSTLVSTRAERMDALEKINETEEELDGAMVAWGVLDGYWEFKLKPWDVSAGALLVREAGGRVTGRETAASSAPRRDTFWPRTATSMRSSRPC